jgi:hypothetical protein
VTLPSTLADPAVAYHYPSGQPAPAAGLLGALLFFDGVALVARDLADDLDTLVDPAVGAALQDAGLLRVLTPKLLVDEQTAAALIAALRAPAVLAALDRVGREDVFYFGRRVFSTLNGPEPSIEMMEMRNDVFAAAGAGATVREHGREPTVPVHARVWAPLLSVLPQILRRGGSGQGVQLHPLSQDSRAAVALDRVLGLAGMPSVDRRTAVELLPVAVEPSGVPLPEVLQFRVEHGERYRGFARRLRAAVTDADGVAPGVRTGTGPELLDEASDLLRLARRELSATAPVAHLGLVGAGWSAAEQAAAPLAPLAAALGTPAGPHRLAAYGYVLTAADRLTAGG